MSNKLPNSLLRNLQHNPHFDQEGFIFKYDSEENYDAIRFHPLKDIDKARYPIDNPVPWCKNSYYLTQDLNYTEDPLYLAGAYSLENACSLFIDHILRELNLKEKNVRILDLCAERSNRATLLSDHLGLSSLIVANQRKEAPSLLQHVGQWGNSNIIVTHNDATAFRGLTAYFDIMVVVAPSSEFQPTDLEKNDEDWSQANIKLHHDRQQRLLEAALPSLISGGYLIYSTKSSTVEENEGIVKWLIDTYRMESVSIPFDTSWAVVTSNATDPEMYAYRLSSGKRSSFFSVLRMAKNNLHPSIDVKEQETSTNVSHSTADQCLDMNGLTTLVDEQKLYAYPSEFAKDIAMLRNVLRCSNYGSYLGKYREDGQFLPDRTLAFNTRLRSEIAKLDLDEQEVAPFTMGRLPKRIEQYSGQKKWYVLRYLGVNIGLVQL